MGRTFTIAHADRTHVLAIVAIDRASEPSSVVALAGGAVVVEAMERGHDVLVALDGAEVVGWAWFSADASRDGGTTGQLYRVAVAPAMRRNGVGSELIEQARETLVARGCNSMRLTLPAGGDGERQFFEAAGFNVDAIVMERSL
jgi:ribosomal protein S18 acetylase RimI-like enzyme